MKIKVITIILVAVFIGILVMGCNGPQSGNVNQQAKAPEGSSNNVEISDFAFSPGEITINVGDSITWTNKDSAPHTATSTNNEFNSDNLGRGDTFVFTFNKPGTYAYHCSIHPSMKGIVIVR